MKVLIEHFKTQPFIRKNDLLTIKIPNFIKSAYYASEKGTSNENQDVPFSYDNFLLIKNFSIFGLCDGHGKYGKNIGLGFKTLFPAYMYYLTMDDNLIERGEDLNISLLSLFKIQENPSIREVNIISYFYKKFQMVYDYIPFIKHNINSIRKEIIESFGRTHFDIKTRFNIDIETSGSTVCSIMLYGMTLYCVNLGDSRAIIGKYLHNNKMWKDMQISIDHKPNILSEIKRIHYYNGKVARAKDENGEDIGPLRVWAKVKDNSNKTNRNNKNNNKTLNEYELTLGLAMSRSIGDDKAKSIGVTFEPDVIEYKLSYEDKFIVIGSDGLFDNLTNKEIVDFVRDLYEVNGNAQDAANKVVYIARERANEKNKFKKNKTIDDISCWVIFLEVRDNIYKDQMLKGSINYFLKNGSNLISK